MSFIVNLSILHEYSIDETIQEFIKICENYNKKVLELSKKISDPKTFIMQQFGLKYKELIEPYKLGQINTEDFLHNLASIFPFMQEMDIEKRNKLLVNAWNKSIKLSATTQPRLSYLLENAGSEVIHIVSNTNELNVVAILDSLEEANPHLSFLDCDVTIEQSDIPVEILPNVFLCLSYRFNSFKNEAISGTTLLEKVASKCDDDIKFISPVTADCEQASKLGITNILQPNEFFVTNTLSCTA